MTGVLGTTAKVRPSTLAEAAKALRDGTGRLLFRGAGTKLDWGSPPEGVDTVVETSGLDGLVDHNPDDATATVQAGMPLERLQRHLAARGQWLAIDPASAAAGATIGGILAAGDAGPRRLRYGTMRDLVIGVTVVLADGAVGRSGGKVIKNVAGYDLAKLFCGSLGTLGLVAEVTVRLHPVPAAGATVRVPADPATGVEFVLALAAAPVEPTAVDWTDGAQASLWVRLEGHPDAVQAQAGAVARLATDSGLPAGDVLDGDDEQVAWRDVADRISGSTGETVVRAGALPSQWPQVAAALRDAAGDAGIEASLCSHAALGLHTARLTGGDVTAHAAAVAQWRRQLLPLGGHAVVRQRVDGLDEHVDAWGPAPQAIALMRRVKEGFDPARRCAPGRFVGGI